MVEAHETLAEIEAALEQQGDIDSARSRSCRPRSSETAQPRTRRQREPAPSCTPCEREHRARAERQTVILAERERWTTPQRRRRSSRSPALEERLAETPRAS